MFSRIFLILVSVAFVYAQEKIYYGQQAEKRVEKSKEVRYRSNEKMPSFIKFNEHNQVNSLKKVLRLKDEFSFSEKKIITDKLGQKHIKVKQKFNGLDIEGSEYVLHYKDGRLRSANGNVISSIDISTIPSISSESALDIALASINANKPKSGKIPVPKLKISSKNYNYNLGAKLVYQFDIYIVHPVSRYTIEVDAHTGRIVNKFNRIHTTTHDGTGETLYDGTVDIKVDFDGSNYSLSDDTRGNGIFTYDMKNGTNYSSAEIFSETDDFINETNNQAGVSAHFGAAATYDYFMNHFSRNSYDGNGAAIRSYVHYSSGYFNAFWDGSRMTYGDGDGVNTTALTTMDVIGHEITHAVTEHSAGLIYQNESGALNESFSDIFGQSIEFEAFPATASWNLADQAYTNGTSMIRSMNNPHSQGDPHTYNGTNWYTGSGDNGGVHTNSGVQNFWYYLLVDGGTGSNDHGYSYNVTGIGLTDAAAIAYRNLTVYLTQNSTYIDARSGAEQSAIDLFGEGSQQHISTVEAWNAVGVPSAEPAISVSHTSIDLEDVPVGGTESSQLAIINTGNGILNINNITIDNELFSVDTTSFSIPTTSSKKVNVRYSPTELQTDSAILTIFSVVDTLEVKLYGVGVEPPVIGINPSSFSLTLNEGDSTVQTLTISNTGNGPLEWNIGFTKAPEAYSLTVGQTGNFENDGFNHEVNNFFAKKTSVLSDLTGIRILYDLDINNYSTIKADLESRGATFTQLTHPLPDLNDFDLFITDDFHSTWTAEEYSTFRQWILAGGAFLSLGDNQSEVTHYNSLIPENSGVILHSFGTFLDPNNPIIRQHQVTDGIDNVTTGGAGGWVEISNQAEIVLEYDSLTTGYSNALMAVSQTGLGRIAIIGDELFYDGVISQSNNQIFANQVIDWLSELNGTIRATVTSGTIDAGSSEDISVVVKTDGLTDGQYDFNIDVNSNDPITPSVQVPIDLTVVGAPNITTSTSLTLDSVYVSTNSTKDFVIRNIGSATLDVTDITFSDASFSIDSTAFSIPAKSSKTRLVTFNSSTEGSFSETMTIASNDGDEPTRQVQVNAKALNPPDLSISLDSINYTLNIGKNDSTTITITNNNNYTQTLVLNIEDSLEVTSISNQNYIATKEFIFAGKKKVTKYELDNRVSLKGNDGSFGYSWKDSDEPGVSYEWVDISSVGTRVQHGDDSNSGLVSIGFDFEFYETVYNQVAISSNGWISFTNTSGYIANSPLPSNNAPETSIGIMMNDLYQNQGSCYYYYDSSANRFIVQFNDWSYLGDGSSRYTMQYILYPNGKIKLQYNSIVNPVPSAVGIQNSARTEGMTIAYNNASFFKDEYAVLISPTTGWLTLSQDQFVLDAMTSETFNVKASTADLVDGDYYSKVNIGLSNDALYNKDIRVHLSAVGVPNISSVSDLSYSTLYTNQSDSLFLTINNTGTKDLNISNMVFSNSIFSTSQTSIVIDAKSSTSVYVYFKTG